MSAPQLDLILLNEMYKFCYNKSRQKLDLIDNKFNIKFLD
jgi:hypothetical protein